MATKTSDAPCLQHHVVFCAICNGTLRGKPDDTVLTGQVPLLPDPEFWFDSSVEESTDDQSQ